MILQSGENQVFFEDHNMNVQSDIKPTDTFIAKSPAMKNIYAKVQDLAYERSSVLILGARGTGCKTIARHIFSENRYNNSNKFAELSCYGLAGALIDKKLFGSEDSPSTGLLSIGSENTLFIKGVELWTAFLQNKLLSYLLQNKNSPHLPRLICYGTDGLSKKAQEGDFSQELFNLLSENLLILPLLSERKEDIPLFVSLFNEKNGFKGHISHSAFQLLQSHSWNGNIPELKNVCLQISILYAEKDFINKEDLSLIVKDSSFETTHIKYNPHISLEDMINRYIELSIGHFKSKRESAKALGISVKTIYNKIRSGDVVIGSN